GRNTRATPTTYSSVYRSSPPEPGALHGGVRRRVHSRAAGATRHAHADRLRAGLSRTHRQRGRAVRSRPHEDARLRAARTGAFPLDRMSTRLNSSHVKISY